MFEPRKYVNQTADWGYEDMLGSYQLGLISEERMAEFARLCDEIEAEHLAKKTNKAA